MLDRSCLAARALFFLEPKLLAITLWHIADWQKAVPALALIQPDVIQLHADPDMLAEKGLVIKERLIAALGHTAPKEWWVGVAGDVGKGLSAKKLEAVRLRGLVAAHALGAKRVVLNCEAAWKLDAPGFRAADAAAFVVQAKSVCGVPIHVTSFDCPGYHAALPWRAFDTADGWLPQIYAAPAKGAQPAPNSKQGRARLKLHQSKWGQAEKSGLLKRRPVVGYVQAHHVVARETMWVMDAHDVAAMWAFPSRIDGDGLLAARTFTALERLGYRSKGRVARFQLDNGLTVDGLLGPQTLGALGLSLELPA